MVRLDFDKRQIPVYFVSKALSKMEIRYLDFERVAAKKLWPNFQAHTIVVLTGSSIKAILHKVDKSGRLLKCSIELNEFDIEYRPRTTIKGQVLADFIVERSETHTQGVIDEKWMLETDGSSQAQDGGPGIVLRTPDRPAIT